jgi:hypothetical protein
MILAKNAKRPIKTAVLSLSKYASRLILTSEAPFDWLRAAVLFQPNLHHVRPCWIPPTKPQNARPAKKPAKPPRHPLSWVGCQGFILIASLGFLEANRTYLVTHLKPSIKKRLAPRGTNPFLIFIRSNQNLNFTAAPYVRGWFG